MFPGTDLEISETVDSPLHGKLIFVLATPETGADLVVSALARLPGVAAAPVAANLFNTGFAHLLDHWKPVDPGDRVAGAADLVDEQEFLRAARRLADALLLPLADGHDFIVEYSPSNIGAVPVIVALYPDAQLLHIVRHGGDVAMRLGSPDRNIYWPRPAPPYMHAGWLARGAAQQWCDEQRAAKEYEDEPNYRVARIERIIEDPQTFLGWLADGVGIDADDAAIEDAAAVLGGGVWKLRKHNPGRPQALLNALGSDLLEHYDYEAVDVGETLKVAAHAELGYEDFTTRARESRLKAAYKLRALAIRWASEGKE